ncbi:hypothetical protein B0T11DRAFT_325269 [Plectosphaerella cucumerina]|uniref:Only prolin and serin are matching in the corresponding protein n=1 Tax=Plectosphaerella cucumerina TaxID=40658 RepID=A0A8K0THV2_9PEZI|nr:hypothetical protein B0T11DRAFT_325269 [Plectosphaerella cucumerina]
MSPKLKPLLLPQLVQERKKMDVHAVETDGDRQYVYYTHNSSSSDVGSPVTPTFSTRGHQRYSSSTSSIDVPPLCADSPVSPMPPPSAPLSAPQSHKSALRQLPDVQEDPMEREYEETIASDQFDLYHCLCDGHCIHREHGMIMSAYGADFDGIDYDDCGFMSEPDYSQTSERKRSDFPGFVSRMETRFPSLSRLRSVKKSRSQMSSPTAPDWTFEKALQGMSRATSSRSSSLSAPSRHVPDRTNEPSLPPTPARSFWESRESVAAPSTIDVDKANNERASIERDRAMATTPLLPPLLARLPDAPQESPLQSPTIAPSPCMAELPPSVPASYAPTPVISAKPSISSFRGLQESTSQQMSPLPAFFREHDEWSDRLGHANFNITPEPYQPATPSLESLQQLCSDWEAARINFTKHIVRTGENYGETSKIYALTEAKWAEIDREWRDAHERTMKLVPDLRTKTDDALPSFVSVRQAASASASRSRSRGRGRVRSDSASVTIAAPPAAVAAALIPRLVDADGKFPARGDEDIVGPMVRDAFMARAQSEDRKGRFWRNLVDKMGLKK